jgi:Amt family ammonium transporter
MSDPPISPNTNLYQYCVNKVGDETNTNAILACFSDNLSNDVGAKEFSRSIMLVYAAGLVFFMQAGFAMVCAGAVRKKNVQNTMLKNLLDACGAAVAFFTVGYAFAFGGQHPDSTQKTFIGTTNFFLMGVDDLAFWLFQYAFSAAAATIVAGTLAERCQMAAYLCYSVLLTGFVYPIVVHAVWNPNGFLSANSVDPLWGTGMVDFAGSGVVHVTGGTTALFATMILGPRRGRFHDETGRKLDKPRDFPGHSIALQVRELFLTKQRVVNQMCCLVHTSYKLRLCIANPRSCVFIVSRLDAWNLHFVVWMVRI